MDSMKFCLAFKSQELLGISKFNITFRLPPLLPTSLTLDDMNH